MSESLVVIRTYGNLLEADGDQIDLLTAGIYSLLFTDESANLHPEAAMGHGVALAVHHRDVSRAEAVLLAKPHPV